MLNEQIGKNYTPDVYRPFVGVNAEFLTAAIESVEEKSGDLDSYLEETLGVDPSMRQRLRERFLA